MSKPFNLHTGLPGRISMQPTRTAMGAPKPAALAQAVRSTLGQRLSDVNAGQLGRVQPLRVLREAHQPARPLAALFQPKQRAVGPGGRPLLTLKAGAATALAASKKEKPVVELTRPVAWVAKEPAPQPLSKRARAAAAKADFDSSPQRIVRPGSRRSKPAEVKLSKGSLKGSLKGIKRDE